MINWRKRAILREGAVRLWQFWIMIVAIPDSERKGFKLLHFKTFCFGYQITLQCYEVALCLHCLTRPRRDIGWPSAHGAAPPNAGSRTLQERMIAREEDQMTRDGTYVDRSLTAEPGSKGDYPMSQFKILLAVALVSFASTGSVSALSCMRPTIDSAYQLAVVREESFIFAYGTLTRSGRNIPDADGPIGKSTRAGYSFPARFSGHLATRRGFTARADFEITVEVQCLSIWCGAEVLGDPTLYALRIDPDRYALEATVCNDFAIRMPDEVTLEDMTDLLN